MARAVTPRSATWIAWCAVAVSAFVIAQVRPPLAARARAVKATSDVFALPPPEAMPAASLGYRSALADLLFANTLVSYGMHGEERRRFEFVGAYLDAILTLDPKFCGAYRYVDTFLMFQAVGSPSPEDVRHARRLLEQGTSACPTDGYLWLTAGQFMAFLGTQFLVDEAEKQAYREAGARALARAAELVSNNENIQWQSFTAAGILSREGKRDAAIAFLEKVYAVTDSEELRQQALALLRGLRREEASEAAQKRLEIFKGAWRADLPYVSRTRLLVLGPRRRSPLCSGRFDATPVDETRFALVDRNCSSDWAARMKAEN